MCRLFADSQGVLGQKDTAWRKFLKTDFLLNVIVLAGVNYQGLRWQCNSLVSPLVPTHRLLIIGQ